MRITDWLPEERPRERLLARGAESLSDAELIAIFLRTGVKGRSALDIARELLARFGSVSALFAADPRALSGMTGLGEAKSAQLVAVMEVARRALKEIGRASCRERGWI